MRVLVVVKTTNYELHGAHIEAKVADGRIGKDALQRLVTAHDEHYQTLATLRTAMARENIECDEISRDGAVHPQKKYDAVVTVGGDGTLLSASHLLPEGGRIVGLRSSVSSVGYLCCAGPTDIDKLIQELKSDKLTWISVSRVKAAIDCMERKKTVVTVPILNDFLYSNTNPSATTRYLLKFREGREAHRSSGIWVATGVGSTAGIYAAGGMKRPFDDSLFQFRVRELYRLGLTEPTIDSGLFDPDQDLLEIENRCPSALLALDGQHGAHELGYGDIIRFRRAAPLLIARPQKQG